MMNTLTKTTSSLPWLLYSYPWMPFPRRLSIYLKEKHIPTSAIAIVHVSDPQKGDCVVASQADRYPPRPQGSLPILGLPPSVSKGRDDWIYVRQSMAIIDYIEEACAPGGELANIGARQLVVGHNALERAKLRGISTLAEELTITWNPVRTFGTGAGTIPFPKGAKEMYQWVQRTLASVDKLLAGQNRDLQALDNDETAVSIGDVVLFQFLEFTHDCYGVDVTEGSGETKADVYGRTTKEEYPALRQFYLAFKKRSSAKRDGEGEKASSEVLARMQTWHDGSL